MAPTAVSARASHVRRADRPVLVELPQRPALGDDGAPSAGDDVSLRLAVWLADVAAEAVLATRAGEPDR